MKNNRYYLDKTHKMREANPFVNNTEIAYQLLLQDILDGTLQPRNKIVQDNIASLFNMSRTPVKEALARLEEEGLVVRSEKASYRVYKPKPADYRHFGEFRSLIEPYAAYLASRNISESELSNLRETLSQYVQACKDKNIEAVMELDDRFHNIIIQASHNPYIIQAARQYALRKKLLVNTALFSENFRNMANKHRAIYDAILHSDEQLAYQQMKSHLQFYAHYYECQFDMNF